MSLHQLFSTSIRRQSHLLQQFLYLRGLHHAITQSCQGGGWLQCTNPRGSYDFFAGDEACERLAGLFGMGTAACAGVSLCFRGRRLHYFDCGLRKEVSAERTFEQRTIRGRFFFVWQLARIEGWQHGLHYKIGITRGFLNARADGG